ncbi:hypothetical protein AALP_AA5G249600 [Arabis alpina]|uniref:Knottin scorpion toxin-like domain-containing protein n=1 Tax=Arabis alpina TaxID=50452 RepID=A0A087GZ73_ARAAL|nr:hypothetical protein AALP_AA5G249600 [Arabis alpina]
MKSVSILALLVLFVVVLEMSKIKADKDECYKAYNPTEGEAQDWYLCAPRVYPSVCNRQCQKTREGTKSGRCDFSINPSHGICFCNYCSDDHIPLYLTKPTDDA